MSRETVLIIDDEPQIRKLLTITLQTNEYRVEEAATARSGIAAIVGHPPDLVLLDLGLPDASGHEVLRGLREWYTNPIIVLTVQSSEEDIIKALDNGADDYLIKPFRTGELLARIRSAIRKSMQEDNMPVQHFGALSFDSGSRTVRKDGQMLKLTATEYTMLSVFVRNEGKVLTHKYLLNQIWGPSKNDLQYLRVFIAQLRKKIENDANRPEYILTESGVGYRFVGNEPRSNHGSIDQQPS